MTLIPHVFPKFWSPKNVVRSMSMKSRFWGPFEKYDGKRAQKLLKFERQHLYHNYWSLWRQLSCKKTLLVISKILRLFITTLTADEKYFLLNRDSTTQPIQMQLSQKQKEFSGFSLQRLKSSLNFEHFQKQHEPHSWCISDVTDSKKRVRSMSNKSCFRRNFEKQHIKRAQTRLKSLLQQLYHTNWSRSRQLSFKKSLLVICKILRFFV